MTTPPNPELHRLTRPGIWLGYALFLFALTATLSCSPTVTKKVVEDAHGVTLPGSSRNFQQKKSGIFLDRGILSLFEMNTNDLQEFTSHLNIKARNLPVKNGPGDPGVNGWNVWPQDTPTFVPADEGLKGLKKTWEGEAKPVQMLSCGSPKGDFLHIEIWSVTNGLLIKMYTDWN
jgi:hypothetical protein